MLSLYVFTWFCHDDDNVDQLHIECELMLYICGVCTYMWTCKKRKKMFYMFKKEHIIMSAKPS